MAEPLTIDEVLGHDEWPTAHRQDRVTVVRLPQSERGLDLHALLKELFARDMRAVFLEGGPALAGSFVAEGLIHRVINCIAPALLSAGKAGLADAGVHTIAGIKSLEVFDVAPSGPDIRLVSRPATTVSGASVEREVGKS